MTWKPKKFQNSGEVELSEEDKKQQKKQQKEYIRYFTTKDVPEGYKELYDDGGYEIRNYKLQQTPIIEQPLTLNVQKPDIYRYEQTIPTFSPALSEYAYTGPEMNYYHSQRRHEGQNIGIYTTKEPKIKIEDFDYPGILNEEDIKIFNRKNYFYGLYSPKTDKIYFHHPLNFRNDYDWIALNHEWDHYIRKHLFPTNNYGIIKSALSELSNLNIAPTPLPETLTTSFKNYIQNNNIQNYFNKDINKNKFYGFTEELSATLGTLKDFLKKKFRDKVTLEELDDEVLDAFPTNLRNSYTDVIFPWIKSLNTGQKQRLLDWMNNPYNVVYNDSKQDKFKDRWYPEQQVEMARRGTKIRMGKNDLDSDNIDEKSDKQPSWWDYDYNDVIQHYNKLHLDKNQLQTLQDIVDVFNETEYSEGVKKAILHNIFLESGFNPNASNGSHYGLLQWTPNIFNSLPDKSARGQARKIIQILTNPKMGVEVRAAYLPEGVHTSEETANFFRALTDPQDSLYYFNAAIVTNGRTKDEVKSNARTVANSGKYIEQNGYAGNYTPGNPLDKITPQGIPPFNSNLEGYNNKPLHDYKTFSYKKGGKMFGWKPKQIYKGENDLDTDDLNTEDKTYRSNERYAIGVTPTRIALVESYEPGSHDYERYGKTSDIYIGNQGSGSYDQWATKDQQKEADIQEQKRIRNLSEPSAFNPTAATDYFNKAVGTVMSPVITGIKKGYDYIKDIPLTFNTSPSVGLSLPTNAVGRITLSDVADNPTVRGFGNGLLSVLTPSKDFGFAFSVGDALSSGDFSKIKAPWNPTNYGFATGLDDKMGQAMNTEVDWIIPLAGAPTVASKGEHAINVARYAQPKYWRYHFRNSMVPSGYGSFKERVGNFIKNIFSGENPIIPGQQPWLIKGTPEYEKFAKNLQEYADMMPGFTVDDLIRARQDAINIYSGAPQQFNTFKIVGVGDNGQLLIDMSDKIREKIIKNGLDENVLQFILNKLADSSTLEKKYNPFATTVFPDIFTSAGGNGQYQYTSLASGTHTPYLMDYDYGILKFKDKQDYQPFIREGDHVSQRLGLDKKADELVAKSRKLEQEVADKHPEYIEYQINLNEGLIPAVKPDLSVTDKIKLGLSKMYLDAGTKVRKLNNMIDTKMNNFEISSIIPGAKPYDFVTEQPVTLLSRPRIKYFNMPLEITEKGQYRYSNASLGFTPIEGYLLPPEIHKYTKIRPKTIINESFAPIIEPIKITYGK